MKLLALLAVLALVPHGLPASTPTAVAPAPSEAVAFKVDSAHSSVVFRVQHLVAPFWGRFNKVAGSVNWDAGAPEKSSVAITIEAGSIDTADAKRDDHLRGPDFFSTKEFPEIVFKSTKVAMQGDKLEITGELTLHGTTKSVTAIGEKTGEGETRQGYKAGFEATFEIKRSDFGVKGYIPAIGDEVRIVVALECAK